MNDIEKLSPDIKQAQILGARQESAREGRRLWREQRALQLGISVDEVRNLDPLQPVNMLGNVGDGQDNLLPRVALNDGITFRVLPWQNMDAEPGFQLYFVLDEEEFDLDQQGFPVVPNFPAFEHTLDITRVWEHGPHRVRWLSRGDDSGNTQIGPDLEFFVDTENPNLQQEPDPILLPGDLPDGDITQAYLDLNGGVTFTLPRFADPRIGDTFSLFINDMNILVDQPAVDPYAVLVDKSVFAVLPEGVITLTYSISDRAGNRTDRAGPQKVLLVKTPAPTDVRPPEVPEGLLITRADARDGVEVRHSYDTAIQADWILVYWEELPQDGYELPNVSTIVPFKDIATPGDVYQATVRYDVLRNGKTYPSGPTLVDVDLTYVGPDNPEDPEVINPTLEPLSLESSTQLVNEIAPADKNNDATITVPMYAPVNVDEIIEVFYGNQSVQAVKLAQTDIDAGEIVVTLPWTMIDPIGNGTIDAYYLIYEDGKPENAQQSPVTPILVTVHNLDNLPVLEFPDRDVQRNVINCENEPWKNGVNLKIVYAFEEHDLVTFNWVLDTTYPAPGDTTVPTSPVEASRTFFSDRVDLGEAGRGEFTYNVEWGEHMRMVTEGSIVVEWTLKRGEVTGTSPPHFVRYNRHRPSTGRPVCPDEDIVDP